MNPKDTSIRDAVWLALLRGEAETIQALLVWADWLQDHVGSEPRRLGQLIHKALMWRPTGGEGFVPPSVELMAARLRPGDFDIRLVITTEAPILPEKRRVLLGPRSDYGPWWVVRRTSTKQLYIRLLLE